MQKSVFSEIRVRNHQTANPPNCQIIRKFKRILAHFVEFWPAVGRLLAVTIANSENGTVSALAVQTRGISTIVVITTIETKCGVYLDSLTCRFNVRALNINTLPTNLHLLYSD